MSERKTNGTVGAMIVALICAAALIYTRANLPEERPGARAVDTAAPEVSDQNHSWADDWVRRWRLSDPPPPRWKPTLEDCSAGIEIRYIHLPQSDSIIILSMGDFNRQIVLKSACFQLNQDALLAYIDGLEARAR